jgi:hypothetical protein
VEVGAVEAVSVGGESESVPFGRRSGRGGGLDRWQYVEAVRLPLEREGDFAAFTVGHVDFAVAGEADLDAAFFPHLVD